MPRTKRHQKNPPLLVLGNPGRRLITEDVHSIAYRHAEDGKPYRHDFRRGVQVTLNRDGSGTLRHRDGRPIWADFPERPYFINAPRRPMASKRKAKTQGKRPPPHGFRSWKEYMAAIRPGAHQGGRMAKGTKTKKTGKRRSAAVVIVNPQHGGTRRKARHYRRNPAMGLDAILDYTMAAAVDASIGVVGKAGARILPGLVGLKKTGALGLAVEGVSALALGLGSYALFGQRTGHAVFVGALMAPIEDSIKAVHVPFLAPALAGYAVPALPVAVARRIPVRDGLSGYALHDAEPMNLNRIPAALM